MTMKTSLLISLVLLSSVAFATDQPKTVALPVETFIKYLEAELSYPNEKKLEQETLELKTEKIKNQMELLDPVTNADSPRIWTYRHDKLEFFLGCLYLEVGDKAQAYRHLKVCTWNNGQYSVHARRLLEKFEPELETESSNKPDAGDSQ